MKIAIITLPLHVNYGGVLQAWALYEVFHRQGHDVRIIVIQDERYRQSQTCVSLVKNYLKRFVKRYILQRRQVSIFYEYHYRRYGQLFSQQIQKFIDRHFQRVTYKCFQEIKATDFDAFCVGSDQVWNRDYFTKSLHSRSIDAFLAFTTGWDVKRIAYAASFGHNQWTYTVNETNIIRGLLSLFNGVSVRERSGVLLIKENIGMMVEHLPDPTLLLDVEDYENLINESKRTGHIKTCDKPFVCAYLLDPDDSKERIVNVCAENFDLQVCKCNSKQVAPDDFDIHNIAQYIKPSIEQWLYTFKECSYVITDSFHGCVFSIIFHKPFIAIGNSMRGMSRFESLLDTFDLSDRLVDINDDCSLVFAKHIDFEVIETKRQKLKEMALEFIRKSLYSTLTKD